MSLTVLGIICALASIVVAVFVRRVFIPAVILAALSVIVISLSMTLDLARSGDDLAATGAPQYESPWEVTDSNAILANLARQHYDQNTAIVRPCGKGSKVARVYMVAAHNMQHNEFWEMKVIVTSTGQIIINYSVPLQDDDIFPDPNPPKLCPTAK